MPPNHFHQSNKFYLRVDIDHGALFEMSVFVFSSLLFLLSSLFYLVSISGVNFISSNEDTVVAIVAVELNSRTMSVSLFLTLKIVHFSQELSVQ